MKYIFKKQITIPDILEVIERKDIDATKVSLEICGNELILDFGEIKLTETEKRKMQMFLSGFGFKLVKEQ
jgi:hypothetical protein